ncbi:hypothetical protein AAEO56_04220 [Flavobacterium sp. DGU11]|uniref:YD repeat-containing protein n=1 Tax=Flavobacterium arundinis TaxID=3139143 RepID=A0ABU9HV62_9FLAO
MKKVFAMAAIALFMMTSCSDDSSSSNNNNNNSDTVLLKKTIETSQEGTLTTTFTYDGNKLMREDYSDGGYLEYSYTNGHLADMKYYDAGNLLTDKDIFTYNSNGKLATYVEYHYPLEEGDEIWVEKSVYTYNPDGTISFKSFQGDEVSQTEPWYADATINLVNGNIISLMSTNAGQTTICTYDTKNSPYKNTVDFDAMALAFLNSDQMTESGINNVLTFDLGNGDVTESITYTYNSDNYPVTSDKTTSYFGAESHTNIQYFYE